MPKLTPEQIAEHNKAGEEAEKNGLSFLESDKEDIDWSKVDKVPEDKSKS